MAVAHFAYLLIRMHAPVIGAPCPPAARTVPGRREIRDAGPCSPGFCGVGTIQPMVALRTLRLRVAYALSVAIPAPLSVRTLRAVLATSLRVSPAVVVRPAAVITGQTFRLRRTDAHAVAYVTRTSFFRTHGAF